VIEGNAIIWRASPSEGVLGTNPLFPRRSAMHIGVPRTKERALAATVAEIMPCQIDDYFKYLVLN
jgi:hypothetical protein